MQLGKMVKILSEEQMSLPTLEETRRVDVDAMELHGLVVKEEGSTSLEPNKIRKEVETITEMFFWGEMHENLKNLKMTPISKVGSYMS